MRAIIAPLYKILLVWVIAMPLLAACTPKPENLVINPNPEFVLTSIAQTVEAKQNGYSLTSTALHRIELSGTETVYAPPYQGLPDISSEEFRSTPFPEAAKVVSVDPVAQTRFPKNTTFTTTWVLENSGSTTWLKDYQIIFFSGDRIGSGLPEKYKLGSSVNPGETIKITAKMVTGNTSGDYHSVWVLTNNHGIYFFPLNVRIKVVDR